MRSSAVTRSLAFRSSLLIESEDGGLDSRAGEVTCRVEGGKVQTVCFERRRQPNPPVLALASDQRFDEQGTDWCVHHSMTRKRSRMQQVRKIAVDTDERQRIGSHAVIAARGGEQPA